MDIKSLVKRLTWYNVKKGAAYLKRYGLKDFTVRLSERFARQEVDYQKWFLAARLDPEGQERQRRQQWDNPPLISIAVPVYQTPEPYLRQMIESVRQQTYSHWELCLADGSGDTRETRRIITEYADRDDRIRYQELAANDGIAGNTNAAFEMCRGEYVGLFDHDDLLEPDALYEIAAAVQREQYPDLLYTDEDKVSADLQEYFQPHFKPDFSLDLLRSNNYICHFLVIKRSLLTAVGGESRQYDGAQDYDLILRCVERAQGIVHIPRILYHWRVHKASTADNPLGKDYALEAGKQALEAHLERSGQPGEVSMTSYRGFYRIRYRVAGEPLVSIIIPNKDQAGMLQRCLEEIQEKSTYRNYEIIIVENNSTETETYEFYQSLEGKDNIRLLYWDKEFNYAAINNFGAAQARGEYLILLNNDITVITPDWIEEMLGNCQRREVGITGARLYFPDNTIQHGGIVIGIGGSAGSMFVGMKREMTGYLHKAVIQQNLSAVTAACLMVRRDVFDEVGGLDEQLAVAFNDVDFCLRVRAAGYLVVYDPQVEMYHYESKTRGYEDTEEKKQRFQKEQDYLCRRWSDLFERGDPYYNPNLSLVSCNYEIRPEREKTDMRGNER